MPAVPKQIEITAYDPSWPTRFRAERDRLVEALGELALRVDHVGSTAVPGLPAKPVVDIQISVHSLHPLDPFLRPLCGLGYMHVPDPDDATYPFFHRPSSWPHGHDVHLCEAGTIEERRHLAFRDYLRDHPAEAAAYAAEKTRLAARFSPVDFASRNAYAEANSTFIEPVLQRALSAGYPHS